MASAKRLGVFLVMVVAILMFQNPASAQTSTAAALSGAVSSQEEGPMEGVLVSAKRESTPVTITVVSDAQGRYSFPRAKLEPGRYTLRIRAAGYDLTDPGAVELDAQKESRVDLKLHKASDLAAQLTNADWLISAPGTEEQKRPLMMCTSCHTLERVFRSRYKGADLKKVIDRMSLYDPGSTPERPQMAQDGPRRSELSPDYLSTVNLSSGSTWSYPLKTLPRPKGNATRVIMTEYDLPRKTAMPHDVIVDSQGIAWYGDFGQQFLGRFDPKTLKTVEYPVPVLKPGSPSGFRVLWFDPQENIWISLAAHAAIAKFDRKTEKFQTWKLPEPADPNFNERAIMVQPGHMNVDGKIWVALRGNRIQRMDAKTGEWEREPVNIFKTIAQKFPAAANRPHSIYDIISDSRNNVYFTDFSSEYIGKVDAKSKEVSFWQAPTFASGPRRGRFDQQGRLWVGEDRGSKFAMFDPATERIQEWSIPTPFNAAYDVVPDKAGDAWTGGMMSDRIARLHPKTGEVVEYLLPRNTNVRKVEVDNKTTPVTFWVGSNHGASIIKLEPLD